MPASEAAAVEAAAKAAAVETAAMKAAPAAMELSLGWRRDCRSRRRHSERRDRRNYSLPD
jgi:hypothetical protein